MRLRRLRRDRRDRDSPSRAGWPRSFRRRAAAWPGATRRRTAWIRTYARQKHGNSEFSTVPPRPSLRAGGGVAGGEQVVTEKRKTARAVKRHAVFRVRTSERDQEAHTRP